MGVSFKVSKTGRRFRPKPPFHSDTDVVVNNDNSGDVSRISLGDDSIARKLEIGGVKGSEKGAGVTNSILSSEEQLLLTDREVSFTLNLFVDGYSIGKPSENETLHQSMGQDISKLLHPYDRASESLFSAIESGRLPSDILDDIPCKYTDGSLICEVRDFRKCASESGLGSALPDGGPLVKKICLRISLENVVKDIPMISDTSWTYGDLMELESRILKALQPQLHLEPTPKLDRLCKNPVSTKLDLALCSLRRKRLRQVSEVTVTSINKPNGKKICIDRIPESSNGRLGDYGSLQGNLMGDHIQENLGSNMLPIRANSFNTDLAQHLASNQQVYQMGNSTPRSTQDHVSGPVINAPGISSGAHDMMNPYGDNTNSNASLVRKRENQDGQMSPLSSINKRARPMPNGLDGMQQQSIGQHMEAFRGSSDLTWKNQMLQQPMARGLQYANPGNQKFSQQVFEGALNQDLGGSSFSGGSQGMRYVAKEEHIETAKLDGSDINGGRSDMQTVETETGHLDQQQLKHQQRLPQNTFARTSFPQTPWNNLGQQTEKDGRKEDQVPKRKPAQSPRLPAGSLVQSPLSTKSGEFSSGSAGNHFGPTASGVGVSQKEKAISSSLNSGDPLQRHHQAQLGPKRKQNSVAKNQAMGMVGSPASVGNSSAPQNAASPSVGTQPIDKDILERFSKIQMVAMRHQLTRKNNKIDEPFRNPKVHKAHVVGEVLSRKDNEDIKDEVDKTLSKSLGGGSMNACKTKVITLVHQERIVQGNCVTFVPKFRTRMIMSEKPSDGTVAMLYGEVDQNDFQTVEDHLPTLPNTHFADLLAKQFTTLMEREGYAVQQQLELKQPRVINQPNFPGMLPTNPKIEMQQYGEPGSGQPSNEDMKPTISGNSQLNATQNPLANARMLPPGTPQALQMSQGMLQGSSMAPRPQLQDSQQQHQQQQQQQQPNQLLQQQQQHPQFQRSMMMANNPLSNLQNPNMQLGNHMVNKSPALQLQLLQQQQQQQQQNPQMQRKMVMGLGTAVGMGNVGNPMGIAGLGNTMNMGNARGIGGAAGISAPMTGIAGMGNMGQNPMGMNLNPGTNISNAISQHLRSGTLAPAVIMASKLRMAQNRPPMLGNPQPNMTGISGARQMHPGSAAGLSMLGQTLNRANMSPMQRAAMGPPKLMAGMNMYMNQQQQQQLMQLQQQQQQQQQLQQQQQQQQQLQQQQQQQQQQLQQLQQQETSSSSLQAVVSSPQVGSPSTMGIPQMNQAPPPASPQQMSQQQRTPMSPQISAGAIHPMSAGNPEACPASPQLSSQTHGSVGSIANSPMDLQGVNKSNSVGNA